MAVTTPLALVVPLAGLIAPQDAAGVPAKVNITGSPATAAVPAFTVAVTVDVVLPSAGTEAGLTVTSTVLGVPGGGLLVWVIVAEPAVPVFASVAFTVQNPTVVDAV